MTGDNWHNDKIDERIQKVVADYTPGRRRTDKEDIVPTIELAMLAHLLNKWSAFVEVTVRPDREGTQKGITKVIDFSGELAPHVWIEVR